MTFKPAALALLFSSILSVSALAEGQRVILVLDASGSMWGQIAGRAKMDIARDVVGKVVSGWKAEDELGLVVYGHREKGSCSDIETVLLPGPVAQETYMSPVMGLVPKGKTPMTQAVRQAAEALKWTERQSTVILVSDGIETCEADPCAVARDLEKLGIGFTVHTVGFGLDNKDAVGQLKCMAEETGGIAVLADNAEELEAALKKTVAAKAVAPPPPEPEPEPAPAIVDDFKGKVMMADGVDLPQPFFNQVNWVFSKDAGGAPGEYVTTVNGGAGQGDIPAAGNYVISVTADGAKIDVPYVHQEGKPNELTVVLNAGIGKFSALLDEATPLANASASWSFSRADGSFVTTIYGATPAVLLNAGDYKVSVADGQAIAETNFRIEAGKTSEHVVFLGAGAVKVSATYAPGGEAVPDGTAFELYKKAGISGQGDWVTTVYGNGQVLKAAAGEYDVVVKQGLAVATQRVKIEAAKEAQVEINLNAGVMSVTANGAKRYEIYEGKQLLDGSYKWLTTTYDPTLTITANAGTYLVKAFGADDQMFAEKVIEVKAGERTEMTMP
jgi:Ca-activated chloride channel homolog